MSRPRPGEGTDCQLGPHHCEFPECACPRSLPNDKEEKAPRDAVIEECARAAERRFAKTTAHHTVKAIAEAIRALKSEPAGIVERLETALASQIEITNTERAAKEKLEAFARSATRDTTRLDWLISGYRYLAHSIDGEFCWVIELDDEGNVKLQRKPHKYDGREAIDAAMGNQYVSRQE